MIELIETVGRGAGRRTHEKLRKKLITAVRKYYDFTKLRCCRCRQWQPKADFTREHRWCKQCEKLWRLSRDENKVKAQHRNFNAQLNAKCRQYGRPCNHKRCYVCHTMRKPGVPVRNCYTCGGAICDQHASRITHPNRTQHHLCPECQASRDA